MQYHFQKWYNSIMNILEYENYQEKTSHGDLLFPYITYPCTIPLDFAQVPLHWHDEAELIYVKKGRGTVTVDVTPHTVSAGTIALILPGQLHAIGPCEKESMEYENIIFHPDILLSRKADTGNTDLLDPLFSGRLPVPSFYTPDDPCYPALSACVDANDAISRTNPFGYQLYIKSQLCMFFYFLVSRCRQDPLPERHAPLEKMKLILKYIETRYMDKITVAEIARACGISASHFMRYFKETTGTTFTAYLNDYRLTIAARLLAASDAQILTVAAECGYDNLSYFNRTFKARFSMTPREYRKQHPAEAQSGVPVK